MLRQFPSSEFVFVLAACSNSLSFHISLGNYMVLDEEYSTEIRSAGYRYNYKL